jgi:hypothetical protein
LPFCHPWARFFRRNFGSDGRMRKRLSQQCSASSRCCRDAAAGSRPSVERLTKKVRCAGFRTRRPCRGLLGDAPAGCLRGDDAHAPAISSHRASVSRGRPLGAVVTDFDANTGGPHGDTEPDFSGGVRHGVGHDLAGQRDRGVAEVGFRPGGAQVSDELAGLPDRLRVRWQRVSRGLIDLGLVPTASAALRSEG